MWVANAIYAVPLIAAAAAAWGLWQRKWYAFVPAVVAGLAALVPTQFDDWLLDRIAAVVVHGEPRTLAMTGLLVDAASLACLVGLWAGWSRAPWFWRASALAGVPAALSLVRANEPILLALIVLPVIAAAAWWARGWRDRKGAGEAIAGQRRFRWQLRDALLLFVPIGLVALAIRSLVAGPLYITSWERFLTLAAALVLLSLSAATAGGGSTAGRRWLAGILCLGLIGGTAAAFFLRANDVLGLAYFYELQPYIGDVALGLFMIAALGIPLAVGITAALYRSSRSSKHWPALVWRSLLVLVIAALGLPLLVIGWRMLPPAIAAKPLPPSETYARLIAVGERLRGTAPMRPSAEIRDELALAEEILKEPGHVWFDAAAFADLELSGRYDMSFDALSQLIQAMEVETARAEARGEYTRCVQLAETRFRLADVLSRGGVMMHWHLARRARSQGGAAIGRSAQHLDEAELRRLIDLMQTEERNRVSLDTVIAYDEYWNWAAFGWRDRFFRAANWLVNENSVWMTFDKDVLGVFDNHELALSRLLQAHLAVQLYRRDHGRLPDQLDVLSPNYLSQLPLDPWTGRPVIFRRDGDNFVLYCTGTDGIDNGGRFGDEHGLWKRPGYDLDAGYDRWSNVWPRNDPAIVGPSQKPAGNGKQ